MLSRNVYAKVRWAVLLFALGCGGKLDGDDRPSDDSSMDAPDARKPSQSGKDPDGATALAECEPGFDPDREPGRNCDWVVDGMCYADKLAACACACPANAQDTFCISDFPQENGRVRVSCF